MLREETFDVITTLPAARGASPPIVPSEGIEVKISLREGNREVRPLVESAGGEVLKPNSTSFPSGKSSGATGAFPFGPGRAAPDARGL
jgi:hypothetical protein